MTRFPAFAFFCLFANSAFAGSGDSLFKELNLRRIHTDKTGMTVLGAWGLANTLGGVAGMLSAKDNEWKRFHEMNTAWGVVNLGIAVMGYYGARRELGKPYSNTRALHREESAKRLYLINAGLDGLYIATGAFLTEHAKNASSHAPMYRGFGKSLMLQGAGLLLFDVNMFLAHQRSDKGWYKALQGICLTGDGIGWHYDLN